MPFNVRAAHNPYDNYDGGYFEKHMADRVTDLAELYRAEGHGAAEDRMNAVLEKFNRGDETMQAAKDGVRGDTATFAALDDLQQLKRAEFDGRMLRAAEQQLRAPEARAWIAEATKENAAKIEQLRGAWESGRTDRAQAVEAELRPAREAQAVRQEPAAEAVRPAPTTFRERVQQMRDDANAAEAAQAQPEAPEPVRQERPAVEEAPARRRRDSSPEERQAAKEFFAKAADEGQARDAAKVDPGEQFRRDQQSRFDRQLSELRDTNPAFAARVDEALARRDEAQPADGTKPIEAEAVPAGEAEGGREADAARRLAALEAPADTAQERRTETAEAGDDGRDADARRRLEAIERFQADNRAEGERGPRMAMRH